MNPVGPLDSKVYWVRRVSIVVLVVAVLIGLVWFLASRTSRTSAGQDAAAVAVNTSAAPTLTGVLAASSGATRSTLPSPSPSPSPSPTASGSAASDSAPVSSPPATTPAMDPAAAAAAAAAAAQSAAAAASAAEAAAAAAAAPTADATTAAPTADATTAAPPAVDPTTSAPVPAPPSYDAQGKLICPDSAIGVTATTAPSLPAGSQPILGMVITNTGTETCQRDVSGTLQGFTVFGADGSRVWATADCFPGQGTDVRELAPGQTLKYTVKWSGKTSAPGCTGDRSPVPAGDYTVVAQLGGLSSPPAAFAIAG